jgi:CHAT domain-containing protein
LAGAKDPPARTALEKSLADARAALYQHYRDQRSTNPVYRNLLAVGTGPIRLSQVQRELVGRGGLMLVYLLGDQSGYVLAIGPRMAEVTVLSLDRTAAQTLEVKPGPLTAARLRAALSNEAGSGVLQMLASKERAAQATAKLAVLWKVLVPEAQRKTLADGSVKRLIVVPDGPLALLPMETLVVKAGEKPEYLLDVGPPVVYGPSATVLHNLAERPIAHRSGDRKPVLSVGDPAYPQPDGKEPAAANSELVAQLDAKSRVAIAGGHLARLPYTAWESAWVSESFTKNGFAVDQLLQQNATKLNVCQQIGGRQVVHLACHGMADQSYGNFFGALALTPGPHAQSDAADDGFLTLAEICELNLKDCELALLSACETNFGPQQRGEGVWALSRGFLVAGARRVVASDWLVDDEAAASLVSYYCNLVARAEKEGGRPDYADSLREAKRWVRRQDNWSSPFYWAPFVLLGPK